MSKIPTAEELLNSKEYEPDKGISFEDYHGDSVSGTAERAMIEFAKLHVKAALEAAAKEASLRVEETGSNTRYKSHFSSYNNQTYIVAKDSILNAYPDNLIQ